METCRKPRARFWTKAAIAWLPVSIGSLVVFWDGWPVSFGSAEWVCSGLIGMHGLLMITAGVVAWREKPTAVTETRRDPNYDLRKLY